MKKFFYRVKEGDTLLSVAERFNVPQTFLAGINELKEEIEEGDILYVEIPDGDKLRVSLENLSELSVRHDRDDILEKNRTPYFYFGQDIFL